MRRRVENLQRTNPRFEWLGELPRRRALAVLSRSHLLVLTSKMEGGANAVCEALALGVPILSARIGGTVGILGPTYPGYFPVRDTAALARLLEKIESSPQFLMRLHRAVARRAHLFRPAREKAAWKKLIREIAPRSRSKTGRD